MQRDGAGRLLTEGRRLFLAAIRGVPAIDVVRKLRVSRQAIHDLTSGTGLPGLALACRIERVYYVSPHAWMSAPLKPLRPGAGVHAL